MKNRTMLQSDCLNKLCLENGSLERTQYLLEEGELSKALFDRSVVSARQCNTIELSIVALGLLSKTRGLRKSLHDLRDQLSAQVRGFEKDMQIVSAQMRKTVLNEKTKQNQLQKKIKQLLDIIRP